MSNKNIVSVLHADGTQSSYDPNEPQTQWENAKETSLKLAATGIKKSAQAIMLENKYYWRVGIMIRAVSQHLSKWDGQDNYYIDNWEIKDRCNEIFFKLYLRSEFSGTLPGQLIPGLGRGVFNRYKKKRIDENAKKELLQIKSIMAVGGMPEDINFGEVASKGLIYLYMCSKILSNAKKIR